METLVPSPLQSISHITVDISVYIK